MIKVVLEYIVGLIISLAGIFSAYLYVKKDLGLFGISALLFIIGVLLLIHTVRLHNKIIKTHKEKSTDPSIVVETKTVNLLKKNNDIASQWKKTEETRDRLKLLKLSAEANGE